MDGDRRNPQPAPIMIIALIIMFTTLRPVLTPPAFLNASSDPKQETTSEAELIVKQVGKKAFWLFTTLAFALAFAAAVVQVEKLCVAGGSSDVSNQMKRGERFSLTLVMLALLCMSLSSKCVLVIRMSPPSSFLSASSLIEGLCLLINLFLISAV